MAKKKLSTRNNSMSPHPKGSDKIFVTMLVQIEEEQYEDAIKNGEMLKNYLPKSSLQRADVLDLLGQAYVSIEEYPKAYAVTDELVKVQPNDPAAWYNHGLASFFTSRFGRAVRDFEHAAKLDTTGVLKSKEVAGIPNKAQKLVKEALKARGKDFTLDQLIEQEDIYQQGLAYMEEKKWQEAEDAFRKCAAIADVLPQPWGNIAGSLLMRELYDEAEVALKHALEIEPTYQLAKQNLKLLPEIRKKGLPEEVAHYDPFSGSTMKKR